MSRHVEGANPASLVPRKTDPKAKRVEGSFDVSTAEKAAVTKKLRIGKGNAVRAPVACRHVSQQGNKGFRDPVVRQKILSAEGGGR